MRALVLVPILILMGCGESELPTKVTQRSGEKPIEAVDRYIKNIVTAEFQILTDVEQYCAEFYESKPSHSSRFDRAIKFEVAYPGSHAERLFPERTPRKAVAEFMDSPAGAYLSDQDKEYIRRKFDEELKSLRERYVEANKRLESFRKKSTAAKRREVEPEKLQRRFFEVTEFFLDFEKISLQEISKFAELLYDASRDLSEDVKAALFLRTSDYSSFYENETSRKQIFSAIESAYEKFRINKPHFKAREVSWIYRRFFVTETAYGLEGFVNSDLDAFAVYSVLGSEKVRSFRTSLQSALKAVYLDKQRKSP